MCVCVPVTYRWVEKCPLGESFGQYSIDALEEASLPGGRREGNRWGLDSSVFDWRVDLTKTSQCTEPYEN